MTAAIAVTMAIVVAMAVAMTMTVTMAVRDCHEDVKFANCWWPTRPTVTVERRFWGF